MESEHLTSSFKYKYVISSVAGYGRVAPLARKVKAGDAGAIDEAAGMMAWAVREVIPADGKAVLVPIPNRTGRAGYTKTLAEKIGEAMKLPVVDALAGDAHTPLYDIKKADIDPKTMPLNFRLIRSLPVDVVPILIDNVLDTGHTARAAYEAIGRGDTLMAVLGDTHKFRLNEWQTKNYPLINNDMATKKNDKVKQQATPPEEQNRRTEKNAATEKTQTIPAKSKTMAGLYDDMKEKHPDAVLLFRTGDSYTALNKDASKVEETLGIVAKKPDRAEDGELKAAFPHHALDTYLPKLIRAGLRVAIVDKLEKQQTQEKAVTAEKVAENSEGKEKKASKKNIPKNEAPKEKPLAVEARGEEAPKEEKGNTVSATKKQERQPREPQMVTVNGAKVSHAHAFQSKNDPEQWYFTAHLDGRQLHPMRMSAEDVAAYQRKETSVETLMQHYYPTKLQKQVPVEEYKAANMLSDGRLIERMTVYKEKDEQRADYGKYKLYAQVGDQRMSRVMSMADQNAFFDRVTTPARLVERNFGEKLHLASAYERYQLPQDIRIMDIRVAKDRNDGLWKISAEVGDSGRTEKHALSYDDGFSLFQTRTATREQLAAKYLHEDIARLAAIKPTVSQGMKM